jgi:hypothetical protein
MVSEREGRGGWVGEGGWGEGGGRGIRESGSREVIDNVGGRKGSSVCNKRRTSELDRGARSGRIMTAINLYHTSPPYIHIHASALTPRIPSFLLFRHTPHPSN